MTEFDYLVTGGGTAGCIVAARLAEDRAGVKGPKPIGGMVTGLAADPAGGMSA